MKRQSFIILIILVILSGKLSSQNINDDLVQFSGVVLSSDSLNPVSFAHIVVIGGEDRLIRGTSADYYGFFSFVAQKLDTVQFSAVGYKPAVFVIPDTITDKRYSLIQLMTADTIYLGESVIYPWPTWEEFKDIFVNLDIPDDDITVAMKNIEMAKMKEAARINKDADASVNYKHYINSKTNSLYSAGGIPSNHLLNPFAWAQFIKAWKEGKFRKDKKLLDEIKRQHEVDAKRWDYNEWIEKE
ncbi:hypothetical protein LJC30_05765 [Odoribacter sp. OttesenSCG-928-L07]|nr:hypothetical protein [Odoribacter sp. OttesenSCG-928-L07]MDL2238603.1 carboxypeptidase-like regulatory domain-containing protein [Bacteroidales bacterium OttesenSCG-928-L14]